MLPSSECRKGETDSSVFVKFISPRFLDRINALRPIQSVSSLSQPLGSSFTESLGATLALVIARPLALVAALAFPGVKVDSSRASIGQL